MLAWSVYENVMLHVGIESLELLELPLKIKFGDRPHAAVADRSFCVS